MTSAHQLVSKLYPKDPKSTSYAKNIARVIRTAQQQRPSWLQAWDAQVQPNWYTKSDHVIYSLYPDLFSPEAKPGTYLRALTKKLQYFVDLGIRTIHLLPIFTSSGDGGFAVDDYQTVDPRFGTNQDLIVFIQQAHKRNIKVALDFVLNHTSDNHNWAKQAKQGSKRYRDYYIVDQTHTGKLWPKVPDIFYQFSPGHWDYVPEMNEYVWATFYLRCTSAHDPQRYPFAQWDLNFRNPEVLIAMLEQLLFLANLGVDVFRFDAASFLWKTPGTNCVDLPPVHHIIQLFRGALQALAPHSVILGELEGSGEAISSYLRNDREMQLYYQFSLEEAFWHALATGKTTVLKQVIKQLPKINAHNRMVVLDECHDELSLSRLPRRAAVHKMFRYFTEDSRALPYVFKTATQQWSYGVCGTRWSMTNGNSKKIELLDNVKFTLGGVPLIYMGQELGVANDYRFQADPIKVLDHRFVKRVPITASLVRKIHAAKSETHTVFMNIKKLIQFRRDHPVLATSNIRLFRLANSNILAYQKSDTEETITVVHNFSGTTQRVACNGKQLELLPYASTWF